MAAVIAKHQIQVKAPPHAKPAVEVQSEVIEAAPSEGERAPALNRPVDVDRTSKIEEGEMAARPSADLTADGELLCCVGPAFPPLPATDPARISAITGEFAAGFSAMADVVKAVSVFGSARTTADQADYQLAVDVARRLGEAGFAVITGGGPGIMEAANRGAQLARALSIGLGIELPHEQHSNDFLDRDLRFRHFFVRKVMFVRYACAFVAFPGGFGTLDELFEALTLVQTGKIQHFPVVLVGRRFWTGLETWLRESLARSGKVSTPDLGLLVSTDDVEEVLAVVESGFARQARSVILTVQPSMTTNR